METAAALQKVEELLQSWTVEKDRPSENRLDIRIKPQDFLPAVKAMIDAHWGYLSAITGVDRPAESPDEGHVEVLYHFCEDAAIMTLRVNLPYTHPVIDSICGLIPSATLYERELIEMLGVYPLRKSFTGIGKEE